MNFLFAAETLGLFELVMFPTTVLQHTWATVVGQTLRFEYASNGAVQRVSINRKPMEHRASLP